MKLPTTHEEAFRMMLARWQPVNLLMPNGQALMAPSLDGSSYIISAGGNFYIALKLDGSWGVIVDDDSEKESNKTS